MVSGITNAISIAAGDFHACALLADGTAKCWGSNSYGEVGNGMTSATFVVTPALVQGL